MAGAYGPFLDFASGVIAVGPSEPVSGLFISLYQERPTILFVFTGRGHNRNGFASMLIRNAAGKLLSQGYEELALFVSTDNPAANLYQELGFTVR